MRCPECDSEDIEHGIDSEEGNQEELSAMVQPCSCNECGCEWFSRTEYTTEITKHGKVAV